MVFDEPRFRISAKQTAKGLWQLDATLEYKDDKIEVSLDPDDAGNTTHTTLGSRLLSLIKETEKVFLADGRKMAGDE